MVELNELKSLALAATPGPWWYVGCVRSHDLSNATAEDESFIAAANPANVLELIERLERAGVELAAAQERCNLILDAKNEYAYRASKAAQRVTYLESAWQVRTFIRKDELIAKQEKENDRVKAELAAFKAEARNFVERVRRGEIRSKRTYQAFVKLLGEEVAPEPVCPSSLHDTDPAHPFAQRASAARRATDAELDELIAQVEASGKPVVLTGGQRPGRASLLQRIKDAVARRKPSGAGGGA